MEAPQVDVQQEPERSHDATWGQAVLRASASPGAAILGVSEPADQAARSLSLSASDVRRLHLSALANNLHHRFRLSRRSAEVEEAVAFLRVPLGLLPRLLVHKIWRRPRASLTDILKLQLERNL